MTRFLWPVLVAGLLALYPVAGRALCLVSSPGANFGVFTGATANPGPTPIYVTCPAGSGYQIGINAGLHAGGTSYNWNAQNGTDSSLLHYQVFRDSARTQYWGNTVNTDVVGGTGTGLPQTIYAYTMVPANYSVTSGTYTDTILLTLWSTDGNAYYANISVYAQVVVQCSLTTSPLAFGTYNLQATTTSTSLAVTCTNGTTYTVGADNGLNSTGTAYQRRMTGPGGGYLAYSLSRNASGSLPWGTTAGTDTVAGTGNGNAQSITAYGAIAAGQYVQPGAYSDTLTFTVNY